WAFCWPPNPPLRITKRRFEPSGAQSIPVVSPMFASETYVVSVKFAGSTGSACALMRKETRNVSANRIRNAMLHCYGSTETGASSEQNQLPALGSKTNSDACISCSLPEPARRHHIHG